jgi:hypothetical protein
MIHSKSRLTLTEFVEFVDSTSGKMIRPSYPDIRDRVTNVSDDDSLVTADGSRRWPHYGLAGLGDARDWWVIADLSGVVDPFEDLVPGVELRIPSVARYTFRIMPR